jgi:hypothetical protein
MLGNFTGIHKGVTGSTRVEQIPLHLIGRGKKNFLGATLNLNSDYTWPAHPKDEHTNGKSGYKLTCEGNGGGIHVDDRPLEMLAGLLV